MRPITPASIASMPAAGLSSSAVQQGSLLSPSVTKAYEMSGAEERAVLRKRVRELESALSRAVTTLSRERKGIPGARYAEALLKAAREERASRVDFKL